MATEKISGAEALIKSLIAEKTEYIFGYPGGAIMPVFDVLYDYRDKLKHILVRHEQGATPVSYTHLTLPTICSV